MNESTNSEPDYILGLPFKVTLIPIQKKNKNTLDP